MERASIIARRYAEAYFALAQDAKTSPAGVTSLRAWRKCSATRR